MARLTLIKRNLMRKKKLLAAVTLLWLNILHLVDWFFRVVFKVLDWQNRRRMLKARSINRFFQKKRMESHSASAIGSFIKNMTNAVGSKIEETTNRIIKVFELDLSEMRKGINGELMKLSGITMGERHRALLMIARDPETMKLFYSLPDDEKESFVATLLRGEI